VVASGYVFERGDRVRRCRISQFVSPRALKARWRLARQAAYPASPDEGWPRHSRRPGFDAEINKA
jgi:hypothetical protein